MAALPMLLHTSPPLQSLPASDADSLYLSSLLQLACPGRWSLTSEDWTSNGGRLPHVTHLGHQIRIQHLSSLPLFQDPDGQLSKEDKVDSLCWKAYIEQNLVDIINHTYYSLPPNYPETIAKAHLDGLRFPENQYIPQRLRSVVKSRLQHVNLWGLGGLNDGDAADEDRQRLDEAFVVGPAGTLAPRAWSGWRAGRDLENRRRHWGEQELEKKIKGVLDPLARRLGDRSYFHGDRPATLDLALFAQLTFVLTPTLPNPMLPKLIRESYPTLLQHHDRLASVLFPDGSWATVPKAPRQKAAQRSYYDMISSWMPYATGGRLAKPKEKKGEKSAKEKQFERGRWLWFAGATVAMVGYLLTSGLVQFDFGGGEDEEGEWVEVDEDGEEEEVVLVVDDDDDE
ncbi:hypothetical protein IAU60_003809 [Kwoniella sp. DSM 27419]